MTTGLWVTIPTYLAMIFLIIHSLKYRGGVKPTIAFFGGAFIYGVIRENMVAYFNPAYVPVGFIGVDLWIGLATLWIIVGWGYAAYISWYLASLITGIDKPMRSQMPVVATIAGLIAAAISFLIELPAVAAGWWVWNFNPAQVYYFMGPAEGMPLLTLGGWAMTVGILLFSYWAIAFHKTRWRYLGIAAIALHFLQLVIVNTLLTLG
ncbi:MAG: hypothetical protein ACFFCO_07425 [Promethearchaeota archaeon]